MTTIKTWQTRMQEFYGQDTRGFNPDSYMLAEITDLRAALASQAESAPMGAGQLSLKLAALAGTLNGSGIASRSDAQLVKEAAEYIAQRAACVGSQPKLTVWEGAMPESNGKSNFTAILVRQKGEGLLGHVDGHTIARSEYPGRVKYEADRVRYLIGEITERPHILDYDASTHSGYTAPPAQPVPAATSAPDGFAMVPTEINAVLQIGFAYVDAAREPDPAGHHTFNHSGWRALLEKAKEFAPAAAGVPHIERDAARYRYLRDNEHIDDAVWEALDESHANPHLLDQAIDNVAAHLPGGSKAIMAGQGETGGDHG